MNIGDDIKQKKSRIRLLALDSDGVLTDGGVYIDASGNEFRRFNIKDGFGLKRIMNTGITVAIISGGTSGPVEFRARALGITRVYTDVRQKWDVINKIMLEEGIAPENVAYMGDDLIDLFVMSHVGLSCAPMDAHPEVLAQADIITTNPAEHKQHRQLL